MDTMSYLLGKKAGGGSGTSNYNDLSNKPSINGVTLSGNKSTSDLGIQIPTVPTNVSAFTNDAGYINDVSGKQDTLVSGTNIKTINNESILGSGNITISGGGGAEAKVYSYNLANISDYIIDAPTDLQTIMDNILTDYNNGNTVFLQDIQSTSGDFIRLYMVCSYKDNILVLSQTAPEYHVPSSNNSDGYISAKIRAFSIVYWTTTKKIRRTYLTGISNINKEIDFLSPRVSSLYVFTPTDDSHPTTKKYVDDKPKTYTGYDATKTQVLKNVNGTLTWIDE